MWSVHALGSSRFGPLRCCMYAVFLSGSDDSICEEAWFWPRRVLVKTRAWSAHSATGGSGVRAGTQQRQQGRSTTACTLLPCCWPQGHPSRHCARAAGAAGPASSHSIAGGPLSWGLGAMCAQRQGHAAPSPPHSITPPRCFSDASEIARCSAMRGPHRRRGHAWQLGSPAGPRGVRFAAPACCDTRSTGRAPCRGLDGAGTGACRGGGGRAVAVPCAQGQEGLPLVLHDLHAIGSRRAVAWGV